MLAILYALFFYWYTPFGGALTDEEIAYFTNIVRNAPGTDAETQARWVEFMESDTGGDWAMWNAVDLADHPAQIDGVNPGDTSEDVVNRYTEPFFAMTLSRASHPVMVGDAAAPGLDTFGIENAENWDSGLLVRYRSRRDLMEIMEQMLSTGDSIHAFKVAAVAKDHRLSSGPMVPSRRPARFAGAGLPRPRTLDANAA